MPRASSTSARPRPRGRGSRHGGVDRSGLSRGELHRRAAAPAAALRRAARGALPGRQRGGLPRPPRPLSPAAASPTCARCSAPGRAGTPRTCCRTSSCAPTSRCAPTTGRWPRAPGSTASRTTAASTRCADPRRPRRGHDSHAGDLHDPLAEADAARRPAPPGHGPRPPARAAALGAADARARGPHLRGARRRARLHAAGRQVTARSRPHRPRRGVRGARRIDASRSARTSPRPTSAACARAPARGATCATAPTAARSARRCRAARARWTRSTPSSPAARSLAREAAGARGFGRSGRGLAGARRAAAQPDWPVAAGPPAAAASRRRDAAWRSAAARSAATATQGRGRRAAAWPASRGGATKIEHRATQAATAAAASAAALVPAVPARGRWRATSRA